MLTADQKDFCLVLANEVATASYNVEALNNIASDSPKISADNLRDALCALGDVSDFFPYQGCPDREMVEDIKRALQRALSAGPSPEQVEGASNTYDVYEHHPSDRTDPQRIDPAFFMSGPIKVTIDPEVELRWFVDEGGPIMWLVNKYKLTTLGALMAFNPGWMFYRYDRGEFDEMFDAFPDEPRWSVFVKAQRVIASRLCSEINYCLYGMAFGRVMGVAS